VCVGVFSLAALLCASDEQLAAEMRTTWSTTNMLSVSTLACSRHSPVRRLFSAWLGDVVCSRSGVATAEHLSRVSAVLSAVVNSELLSALDRAWRDHHMSMIMIRDILMYMDRSYVVTERLPGVFDMGLVLFRCVWVAVSWCFLSDDDNNDDDDDNDDDHVMDKFMWTFVMVRESLEIAD
jgi:hypothetical protein